MSGSVEATSKDRRRELIDSFQDREAREGYAEGFLHTWIASQLATIRQQRGLTQKALAEAIGTKQPGVARMERDDYGKWNLATLARSAAALDCRLKVSIETYGTLIDEILEFTSPDYLKRPDFAHDPILFPRYARWKGLDDPGPVGYMRRQIEEWIGRGAPVDQLSRWLEGRELPPVGDELPASCWLSQGLEGCPEEENRVVVSRVQELLFRLRRISDRLTEPDLELVTFLRRRPDPEQYESPLIDVHEHLKTEWGSRWHVSRPDVEKLSLALADNQTATAACRGIWRQYITRRTDKPELWVDIGLYGCATTPSKPNAVEVISEGLEACFERFHELGRNYYEFIAERLRAMYARVGCDRFSVEMSQAVMRLNPREPNIVAILQSTRSVGPVVPYQGTVFAQTEMVKGLAAAAAR